jgi:hypothetical protein
MPPATNWRSRTHATAMSNDSDDKPVASPRCLPRDGDARRGRSNSLNVATRQRQDAKIDPPGTLSRLPRVDRRGASLRSPASPFGLVAERAASAGPPAGARRSPVSPPPRPAVAPSLPPCTPADAHAPGPLADRIGAAACAASTIRGAAALAARPRPPADTASTANAKRLRGLRPCRPLVHVHVCHRRAHKADLGRTQFTPCRLTDSGVWHWPCPAAALRIGRGRSPPEYRTGPPSGVPDGRFAASGRLVRRHPCRRCGLKAATTP